MLPASAPDPISYLLVKVAARCNIDCSYCYWFRDGSVYDKPKLMKPTVLDMLLQRVEEQIRKYSLQNFDMLLHGGEPLLWGVDNFTLIAERCREITARTGCPIGLATTTNGVLIDEAWLDCFEKYDFSVTISIDGPDYIHDVHRRTFQGGPTHAAVERALRMVLARGLRVGVLAVCNPAHQPEEFVDYFTSQNLDAFDIMLPDATFEDRPASIGQFYRDLFDLWLERNRDARKVKIRTIEAMVAGLLGGESNSEAIGYGPIEVCTVLTDGGMEPLDVLRIAGEASTHTSYNLFQNSIEDIKGEPRWQAALSASLNLCEKCRDCKFMQACGGGYLPHRFSKQNGYDNPSAYCDDLYSTLTYMQSALEKLIYIGKPTGERINLAEAMTEVPGAEASASLTTPPA